MQSIDDLGVIAAVSPHVHEAVAGCGALLAAVPGSTVVTVFAGIPDAAVPLTDWDRRCGFGDGQAAMKWRLGEDDKALHLLKARPARLPFLGDQYVRAMQRSTPKVDKVAHALEGILEKSGAHTVLFPLGLFHCDHILVSDAALNLFGAMRGRQWLAYEDAGYRARPGLLQARLVQFYTRGISLTPIGFAGTNVHRKATAMAAYASRALEAAGGKEAGRNPGKDTAKDTGEATAQERYWLLGESVKQAPHTEIP